MTKITKLLLFTAISLIAVQVSYAQRGQLLKAEKEYDKYAYIDAQQVYLQVAQDGYKSEELYENLGNTYYYNSQYQEAAKWYEALIQDFGDETNPINYFRLAQCYRSMKEYDKSDKMMETFIAKGGDTKIAANFADSSIYLEKIQSSMFNFEVRPVAANSASSDFGPSFYKDQVVFASASDTIIDKKLAVHSWNNQPFLDLFVADVADDGNLQLLDRLPGDVNSKYHESSPTFTQDGQTMYFTRNNYLDGRKGADTGKDKDRRVLLKIYRATWSGGAWTNIEELPFNDDAFNTAHPALSVDQKRLYFVSDRPGSVGMSDIWYADINEDGSFGEPMNLEAINTEARESFPFIASDNTLYFASDGRNGLGGFDVYSTKLDEAGMPSDVDNLGAPANSSGDDFGFIYNVEKRQGYVSSNRSGTDGFVNDDIYLVVPCEVSLSGVVTDIETGELLPGARVQLFDASNTAIGEPFIVGEDARYEFPISCGVSYRLLADKQDYEPKEVYVDAPTTSGELIVPIALQEVDCPSYDLGCKVNLQPIYFDLDRYNIRPDAEVELAKILAAMNQYPELNIHIESHTDSRATDQYNIVLSERRAQSTMNWLIDKGIDPARLSAKGYGETQLVNDCANGVPCSEEQHQLNRRSMFIIKE